MALLGLSLIVASLIYILIRPPRWLPPLEVMWRRIFGESIQTSDDESGTGHKNVELSDPPKRAVGKTLEDGGGSDVKDGARLRANGAATNASSESQARIAMPPPPLPASKSGETNGEDSEEQTTPKATAAEPPAPIPSFSLTDHESVPPQPAKTAGKPSPSTLMAPPPVPASRLGPPASASRPPSLPSFPAPNSAQRARGPLPNRGPASSSGLAPPPTHSSAPSKPSRKVLLEPGHSPLDWARISSLPTSDLRNVPPDTPFLRVPPSLLKSQNGRKGKDAWMALNGKVYNVQPYAKFHPGGVGELMRGAGKDGTRLFGEVHPWVNYETMLQACLVGLLVEESAAKESEMDKMD